MRSAGIAAAIAAIALAGCGTSITFVSSEPASTASAASPPAAVDTAGPRPSSTGAAFAPTGAPTGAPTAAPTGAPTVDPTQVTLALRRIATGFSAPVGIVDAGDGRGRLFVVEQAGRIRILRAGAIADRPFLDISALVSCCGERGLLGLVFAPGFGRTSRAFYVDYTDAVGNTVIARATVGADPDVADAASLTSILEVDQPFANHNGGQLAFGPDGYLYIGLGDGGSGGDPFGNGQDRRTLLGKILRIDVSGPGTGGRRYRIPPDNPFADGVNGRPEIWAYGLRNPWRFSFDRSTGDLWIGDVGQDRYEEVDHLTMAGGRGANLGWNLMEGLHCYPSGTACRRTGLVLPVAEYDHSSGDCAIIGGFVYRGASSAALDGLYLFGDTCTGRVRAIVASAITVQTPTILRDTGLTISSFGEDASGELYVADLASGSIYEIVASAR